MPASLTARTDLRQALTLVESSDEARRLRAMTPDDVEIDTPLADWLYAHWWAKDAGTAVASPLPHHPRVGMLDAARRRAAGEIGRWIVLAASDALLTVVPRDAEAPRARMRAGIDAVVRSSRPGRPPKPGDLVTLTAGSSGWDRASGWWWAHSALDASVPDGPLDRWYVHSRSPECSARLLAPLLSALGDARAPFSLKCLPTPEGYGRADALVVYAPRSASARVRVELRRRADEIAPFVAAPVPPTTGRVLPGVALAEDPPNGESFGQLRTAQVATLAARIAATVSDEHLTSAAGLVGIDLARPWRAA